MLPKDTTTQCLEEPGNRRLVLVAQNKCPDALPRWLHDSETLANLMEHQCKKKTGDSLHQVSCVPGNEATLKDVSSLCLTSVCLPVAAPSVLTDRSGGLQLTPLIRYAGSRTLSPSVYLFLFLSHWLTHSCSRSIKLIKGSILSWSPLANSSANQ